jgi:hypothetical protein
MDINISDILVGVLTILAAMGSWFARQVWSDLKILEQKHQALEIKIAQDYVRHDRLQDAFKPIMDALAEIKETLKTKADK